MSKRLARVGELAEQIRGVSYAKEDASLTPKSGYLPVLRAGNITDYGLIFDDLVFVPAERIADRQKIRCHDILIAASSGSLDVVGKAASAQADFDGGFGAFCKVLRPNSKVHPGYFAQFFKTQDYRRRVSALAAGANINNLRNEHLDEMEIPLPPLPEQRRIAEVLDRAEALRAKRRAALAQLDTLTQAIFLDMFGDPAMNPKGWQIRILGELGDGPGAIVDGPFGSAINVKEDYIEDGEIPVIRTKNVRPFEFITDDLKRISRAKFNGLERSSVIPGDIILTKVGTIGNVCFFPSSFAVGVLSTTGSCRIRPNEKIVQRMYLAHFLNLYRGEMMKLVAEGVQPFLNMKHIKSFRVPIPSIGLQDEFARRVAVVEKLKTAHRASLAELDALFAALQHRAFRGEL